MFDQENHRVVRVACSGARNLFLSGEFNHWRIPGVEMRAIGRNLWEAKIPASVRTADRVTPFTCVEGRMKRAISESIEVSTARD